LDIASYQVNKKDLYDVYMLEYKVSEVLKKLRAFGGHAPDSLNLYHLKLNDKLEEVVDRLLRRLHDIFDHWVDFHIRGRRSRYDELWLEEEADIENVFDRFIYDPELDEDGYFLQSKEDLLGGTSIIEATNMLKNAITSQGYQALKEKIKAINYAIHVCHTSGLMLAYPGEDGYGEHPMEILRFLDDLTGGKFISQWDREIEKMANQKNNWYKLAQQLELFEYGDDIWLLTPSDLDREHGRALREQRTRNYNALQELRRERGSYYEPQEFEGLTSALTNSALRLTQQDFHKEPLDYEIIGSWFTKNSRGVKPKDFDILVTVDDVTDIIGERILRSRMEFSGIEIDVFYTDGQKSVAPVAISPQQVEYQVKKIRGI